MTQSKATKRALLASVISLLLCFSMLLGTTYAWFTDTVASTGNIIRSGTLDADLVDAQGNSLEGKPLTFQKASGAPAGEKVLWEPGCTYNLQDFKVVNKGNLAFKFKFIITGIEGDAKLLEAIDWTVTNMDDNAPLNLNKWYHLKPNETYPSEGGLGIRITGHMREDAGNEYQDLMCEGISIMIYAIQDTVEYDSFDNQYDGFADIPSAKITYLNGNNSYQMISADDEAAIRQYVYAGQNGDEAKKADILAQYAKTYSFDSMYKFSVTDEQAADNAYATWNADFVVSADKDVPANSIILAGQYATPLWNGVDFPWIYLQNKTADIAAGTEIRLLQAYGRAANYSEIVALKDFYCGLADVSNNKVLAGTTVSVELRLFKTAMINGTATETGESISLGTTTYTFGDDNFIADVADLNRALANGGEYIMVDDILTSSAITVPAGKELVLDLNGHTISGAFSNNGGSALIDNKGTLTIKNGNIVYLAQFPDVDWAPEGYPTYATNTIANRGTLVIEEGAYIENQTVGGASYAIDNYAGATLTVNDGIVRAKNVAIRLFTSSDAVENNVTINGGCIIGKRAVWVHLAGSKATVAPKVNLTINGGELYSNAIDITSALVMYSYSFGNSFANTNITITGGQFLSGSVQFGGGYKGDTETVSITGGTFEQDVIRWVTADDFTVLYTRNYLS